jgi:hypothetical protein
VAIGGVVPGGQCTSRRCDHVRRKKQQSVTKRGAYTM